MAKLAVWDIDEIEFGGYGRCVYKTVIPAIAEFLRKEDKNIDNAGIADRILRFVDYDNDKKEEIKKIITGVLDDDSLWKTNNTKK